MPSPPRGPRNGPPGPVVARTARAAGAARSVVALVLFAAIAPARAAIAPAVAAPATREAGFTIGTARSVAGKKVRGVLQVGERADGTPVSLPLTIISGRKPGPLVWVDALAHGDEYGGARALHEIVRRLDPATMTGHVVAVLATNPLAMEGLQRTNPSLDDLADIGEVFPGDRDGFATERLAAMLGEQIRTHADYFVDLHTGGDRFVQHPFVLYTPVPAIPEARFDTLARAFGIQTLWKDSSGTFKRDGLYIYSGAGIPAFLIEVGGGQPLDPADLKTQSEAVMNFLPAVGVTQGSPPHLSGYVWLSGYRIVTNARGGFFDAKARRGDRIREGDVLGTIRDMDGEIAETIRVPPGCDIVLGVSTYPAAPTGGWIFELGTGLKEAP